MYGKLILIETDSKVEKRFTWRDNVRTVLLEYAGTKTRESCKINPDGAMLFNPEHYLVDEKDIKKVL